MVSVDSRAPRDLLLAVVFLFGLIGLSRLIGLPGNFTPIIAGAVFLPIMSRGRHLVILPVLVMFVTDLFLGFHATMAYTYGAIFLISVSANYFKFSLIYKALVGVLVWHLIVNFGVYIQSDPVRSLVDVYVSAWPFDFRTLVSTLLFTSLFWLIRKTSNRFIATFYAGR